MPTVIDDTAAALDAINSRILDNESNLLRTLRTPVGIIAAVLSGAGVRAHAEDAFWADWQMLEARGDFAACRQPGDYCKVYLRLKLQQMGG